MSPIVIRPAEQDDVEQAHGTFPDLLPDRWRDGGNRRSFVALQVANPHNTESDPPKVVGHCRGVDNAAHPGSRVIAIETLPVIQGTTTERNLLGALLKTSPLPLHSKVSETDTKLRALLRSFGGVLVQLMPPGRYLVDAALKRWARATLIAAPSGVSVVPAAALPLEEVVNLEVDHYIEQHESWSPAANRSVIYELIAEDHDPDGEASWSRDSSYAITASDGTLQAAALVWGDAGTTEAPPTGDTALEVGHMSRPYASAEAWTNKFLAIAAVIQAVPTGTELFIDSHLSMTEEFRAIGTIPGSDRDRGGWTAIIATPPDATSPPDRLPPQLIPDSAAWAREFAST